MHIKEASRISSIVCAVGCRRVSVVLRVFFQFGASNSADLKFEILSAFTLLELYIGIALFLNLNFTVRS